MRCLRFRYGHFGHDKGRQKRLRCSTHTNSGNCPNPRTFYLDDVEDLVIDTLANELATTEQVHRYAKAWLKGRHKQAAKDMARCTKAEIRLKAIVKELGKITRLLTKGIGDEQALDATNKELGAERDRLSGEGTASLQYRDSSNCCRLVRQEPHAVAALPSLCQGQARTSPA